MVLDKPKTEKSIRSIRIGIDSLDVLRNQNKKLEIEKEKFQLERTISQERYDNELIMESLKDDALLTFIHSKPHNRNKNNHFPGIEDFQ